jgi:hypothetical protein
VSSKGDRVGGGCIGGGSGAEFSGEFGGTTKAGCEEEARSGNGLGEKPSEFPRRSNHSTQQAHGEDKGGRLLWLWEDWPEEEGEEGGELCDGARAGWASDGHVRPVLIPSRAPLGFPLKMRHDWSGKKVWRHGKLANEIDENQGGMQIEWWLCWEEEELMDQPRSGMIWIVLEREDAHVHRGDHHKVCSIDRTRRHGGACSNS